MARTWLAIQVQLVSGRGERLWPRPGRVFAASRSHTFEQLGRAINDAFARWDLSHLSEFVLEDETRIGNTNPEVDPPEDLVDASRTKLGRLEPNEFFAFTFDFGDDWNHLCWVWPERVDPLEVLGVSPERPLSFFGWGTIPDQYGRRWMDDDGSSPPPPDPQGRDLPPILPEWR